MGITSIKTLMKAKQADLKSKLDVFLCHSGTKGNHCESAWIDFFRSFLPNKYAVDKGFVFDSKGKVSEQIDIIIYDALYTPLIFGTESGEKYVTAESVYAVFESKSKITKYDLKYANEKIYSVVELSRSRRGVINVGKPCPPRDLTEIIGGILAIDSINMNSIAEHMRNFKYIDVGCAIKKHSFLVKRDKNIKDKESAAYRQYQEIVSASDNETILSFFYIILDELYKLGTVAGIDIRAYANETLQDFQFEIEDERSAKNETIS